MRSRIFSLIICLSACCMAWANSPKYIFYFIGDGMGLASVMVTEAYNRTVLNNPEHLQMLQFPVVSYATTYSGSSQITDSAAAGTALATGNKTGNGMVGVTIDSIPVQSVATALKNEGGYGVAIATTVTLNDATPAAFYGHAASRKWYYETGSDIIDSKFDLLAGYNLLSRNNNTGAETDMYDNIKKAGYTFATGKEEYEKVKGKNKIIYLNKPNGVGHCGYTVDSLGSDNFNVPYLTQTCLDHLQRVSPDKFFMMIEGGNIDWAAHSNDPGVVKSVLDFDAGIKIAYNFYLQHPDETLIVVTADHNTGGLTFGKKGNKRVTLENLDYQKVSISMFEAHIKSLQKQGKDITWDYMQNYIKENLGLYGTISVDAADDKFIKESFDKTFVQKNAEDVTTLYATYSNFVADVFGVFCKYTGLGWTTTGHTGDFVPVFAIGVGAENFNGLNDNTDLPKKIAKIAGVKF